MQTTARVAIAIALALAGCGDNAQSGDDQPIDPSDAANFRGYAAVQDDLYAKLMASDSQFELFFYLGDAGDELSKLVGRPDGFGVQYDVRNARPNAMNVLVWRMMMQPLANDLAATCPHTALKPIAKPAIQLNPTAAPIAGALCAWPDVTDEALGDAWDVVVGYLAPESSRAAFIQYAHDADLASRKADDALPNLWLGALLHPAFLLEQ